METLEAGMRIHGTLEPSFWEVASTLESQVDRRGGGAAVCVYHRGVKVVDLWAGARTPDGHPWQHDTLAMSFSTTKGALSTLAHVLADRGLLDYDAPVARYWPEFAQAGKAHITVREVMTHRAGLAPLRTLIDRAERMLDWDHMTTALAAAPPSGACEAPAYHALTYGWLLGEIVQRAGGRRLPELIASELAEPLELDGFYIGAPPAVVERVATLSAPRRIPGVGGMLSSRPLGTVWSTVLKGLGVPFDPLLFFDALLPPPGRPELLWEAEALHTPIPAANGLFTARALARMYAMLAEGGELDGRRLLSARTVREAGTVQTTARDRVLVLPMHWRLGYHSAYTMRGRLATAFGHFGYGGSGAWACPERRLAVAMTTNQLHGGPIGDFRIAEVGSAALRSARRVAGRYRERLVQTPVAEIATAV
jgi:CubicO group peptidase (beta-lactamase class C family)